MASKYERHNDDGTTFVARTRDGIMGTLVTVTHSVIETAGGALLWDHPYGTRMHYLPGGGHMVPITHPDYSHAVSRNDALRVALAFFGESYEDTCKHARDEGIPVRDCFR